MKIRYFQQTDTLYIEIRQSAFGETKDLDEDTLLDLDRDGRVCAITFEHVSERTDPPGFSFEHVRA